MHVSLASRATRTICRAIEPEKVIVFKMMAPGKFELSMQQVFLGRGNTKYEPVYTGISYAGVHIVS